MTDRFHKLSGNKSEFPHLSNVDVYKYDNDFDYSRYDYTQMELQICTVPWDMGEAHIGNRTISGIGNVVYFENKAARDAWFDAIPDSDCFRFSTKFKELHRNLYIDVPIPYDVAAKFNYLRVKYSLFANDESPVMYESADGLREWFWFIREVEFVAPNNTRLHILDDAFQTWIYDVNVSGMVLERGHAPMFAMKADEYLSNPIAKNAYLLTEDVNFGKAGQVKHIDALVLNANDMYACIATTGNVTQAWGAKDDGTWKTPSAAWYNSQGVPSVKVFAVRALSLNAFLENVTTSYPQFKQTIQGVFFASTDLITLNGSFTFADTTCYNIVANRKTFDLMELEKSLFGYSADYQDIAKLYTSPYAHIEVTDENGNVDVIRIEDTSGNIDVSAALSIAYPFVNIDAHLLGVGGSASASITFRNIDAKTFDVGGTWYETLRSWKVPTFAVVLDASREYDYSSHFDRAQRVIDYTAQYENATASALATRDNSYASADTTRTNAHNMADAEKAVADNSADTIMDNADLSIDTASAVTNRSNQSATNDLGYTTTYNTGVATADNILVGASASSTIAANEQQGAIATGSGIASAAVGAIGSAATGNIPGAAMGVANGIIGAATTMANTAVTSNLTATQASITQASNSAHATASNSNSTSKTGNQTATATAITGYQNDLTQGVAANNSATMIENAETMQTAQKNAATATRSTERANAGRSYDTALENAARTRAQAVNAINNDISQAALRSPFVYGSFADGDSATTKPIALFANVVTQSESAITSAGDEFLRYGYALDKQWPFDGNWNVGKYFTYWKLRDFWVSNLNVPDMYMDKLRFFLFGGVTVWRKPEDIGKVSIYENYNG